MRKRNQIYHPLIARILIPVCLFMGRLTAQPAVEWDRTIGWEGWEDLNGLRVLPDGIITAGSSSSVTSQGRVALNDWSLNMLFVKTDFDGKEIWRKTYGGFDEERLWKVIPTSDGGFLGGGYSKSGVGLEKSQPNRGKEDVWIIKLDAQGNKLWDKTFGGDTTDILYAICEMPDGGFMLGCDSYSGATGDKTEPSRGNRDWWLIRTDAQGNKLWDKTIGGDFYDQINDIEASPDGNLYISGGTRSAPNTGEVGADPARGNVDFWLMKFNPQTRQILWNRRFGGIYYDFPYALVVAGDGTVFVGGPSQSPAAPPLATDNGKNAPKLGGSFDGWIVSVSPNGQKINDFGFGGSGQDEIYFMMEDRSRSGQLVVGGFSNSPVSGNKTSPNRGNFDYWIFGVEPNGTKMWEWTAGGTDADVLYYLDQLPTGALILGGTSLSPKSFEKSENPAKAGLADFWLLGTHCDVAVDPVSKNPLIACTADTYGLEAKVQNCAACEIEWSNGAVGMRIELQVGTVDTLHVLARDAFLCFDEDSIFVDIGPAPGLDIGPPDTLLLAGDTLRLGLNDQALRYKWSTGDTVAHITVQRKGIYALTVTNARGCTAADQIVVTRTRSEGIWVPNAFSPNGDGMHDVVWVFTDRSVRNIVSFKIADRWGNLLFQRENQTSMEEADGWNGVFRGQVLPPGVYTWTAEIDYLEGPKGYFAGTIALIR